MGCIWLPDRAGGIERGDCAKRKAPVGEVYKYTRVHREHRVWCDIAARFRHQIQTIFFRANIKTTHKPGTASPRDGSIAIPIARERVEQASRPAYGEDQPRRADLLKTWTSPVAVNLKLPAHKGRGFHGFSDESILHPLSSFAPRY